MKSYTDIEQSEKLAKILPIETSDHHYVRQTHDYIGNHVDSKWSYPKYGNVDSKYAIYFVQNFTSYEKMPCWSLAALMEILNGAAFTRDGTAPECYEATIFYTDEAPKLKRMTCTGTSYVDACYKMIMKLHEMNILSLPKTMEEQS